MKINGRLLLLAVVTGLFIRIWSSAGLSTHREQAAVSRRPVVVAMVDRSTDSVRHSTVDSISEVPTPSGILGNPEVDVPSVIENASAVEAAVPMSVHSATEIETWTENSAPIPLPNGISTGTWRVVNDAGRVAHLVVITEPHVLGEEADVEFHVSQLDGRRWYFIRLNTPGRIETVQPVTGTHFENSSDSTVTAAAAEQDAANEATVGVELGDELPAAPDMPIEAPVEVAVAISATEAILVINESPMAELQLETTADLPACEFTNRKFDFTGYEAATTPITVEDTDRPAEVELPID